MPDFFQHFRLPTLHHLADCDLAAREAELAEWAKTSPIALLLPALYSEFEKPALQRMLRQIADVPYISEVILSVNRATAAQIKIAQAQANEWLGNKPVTLLWNDGPALKAVHRELEKHGMPPYRAGKGSNIWMGVAYLAARREHRIVVSHDTDILSYERGLLWRLCYPVAHPEMPYRFAKGYYGRVGDRMYGRVTRLLVLPLIHAFMEVQGRSPLLEHLEGFRYPLSGEFCADLETLSSFEMPRGWGLEMCLLCEVFEHLRTHELCQVDLGFNFEHRHRSVSNAPAANAFVTGLVASATEVASTLAAHVAAGSSAAENTSLLNSVISAYRKIALEWVPRYQHDAHLNGLRFDVADEQNAVQVFTAALVDAFQIQEGDIGPRCVEQPSCKQTLAQVPGIGDAIIAAAIR
ncbi:MAG: hypothetical protein JWO89_925 [Verrucomicrobiaceae bacterium]|nr:hypothetical protein [Verrucomicrobiaceae bacterium]